MILGVLTSILSFLDVDNSITITASLAAVSLHIHVLEASLIAPVATALSQGLAEIGELETTLQGLENAPTVLKSEFAQLKAGLSTVERIVAPYLRTGCKCCGAKPLTHTAWPHPRMKPGTSA